MRKLYLLILASFFQLVTFSQTCTPVTSFFENFDGVTVPALPSCWVKVGTTGAARTQATSSKSSPNTMYIYSSSTTNIAIVSMPPVSNVDSNNHQIKFSARGNFTAGATIQVGYLTNPTDSSTFVSMQDVVVSSLTYQTYTVIPSGASGPNVVFAFRHTGSPAYSVLIDDVSWESIPSCVEPSAVVHSNVTISGAQIDWTAPSVSTPSSYEIYSSTSNTAPTGSTTPNVLGISGTTYSLTGLISSTKYFVWVRSNCGSGGTSLWSAADSFFTLCNSTNVPYVQDFESATVPGLPPCTAIENAGTGNNWITGSNPGNGFTTKTLRYNYNGTNAANAWFYTQGLNLTGGTSYRIKFKYGNNSTTYVESMNVSYGTSPSAVDMTNTIVDYPSITGGTLANSSTDFTPAASGVYYIGFHAYSIANQFYLYVDDISVDIVPLCSEPTALIVSNINQSTAQLDWTAPLTGSPASYDVYYSTNNTAPTGTTTPSATAISSTTYNMTALSSSTKYFVWVRSDCGTGGKSPWSIADSFFTSCNSVNVPYTQDFESATVPALPNCTSNQNVGSGNNWITINNPGYGFTSKTLEYVYNGTNPADVWFYTQGLNLTAGTSYRITFKYGNNSTTYTESMNVSYGTSPNATDMTNLIVDYPAITGAVSSVSSSDFTPVTTGVYYIGFHSYSIANQFYLYVDDISVTVTPLCNEPTTLVTSNITSSGAQIDWTAPSVGSPATYEMYYSTDRTKPADTATATINGITGTTYTLSGLLSSTAYYVWVRSNCGTGGGKSIWSAVDSFVTACIAVPSLMENFDSVITPSLPTCWSKILRGATLSTFASITTTTGNTNSAPNAVSMYNSSSTSSDDIILVSPPVSNLAAGTYQLSFYAKNSVLGQDLEIGTLDNNSSTATFTSLQTVTVTTTYQKFNVSFAGYSGTDTYIGIRRLNATTFSYVYLDDIKWELAPLCNEPTALIVSNITSTSAQLDWTPPASGTPVSYDVYFSTSNTAPIATTTPSIAGVSSTSVVLSPLNNSSTYYVWVRSNCGTGGYSSWSSNVSFATLCGVIVVPTVAPEPFTSVIPGCWSRAQGLIANPTTFTSTTTSGWTIDDYTNITTPVNKSAKLNIYGTTRKEWLITPSYDLGTTNDFKLEFDLALTTWNLQTPNMLGSDDKFLVVISTDNGVTWSNANVLRTWDTTTSISSTGEHVIIDLAPYSGIVQFGFYGESTITGNGDNDLFIDNVEIKRSVLPVTLMNFKGDRQGNRNLLSWVTSSEQNNTGYELLRSSNGETFSPIAFVQSKAFNGNSTRPLNYNFSDEKPFSGNNYYRLKQVDRDGKSILSNIVLIKGSNTNSIVLSSVYPNPAKSKLNMVFTSPNSDKISIIITDFAGKVVMSKSVQLGRGDNILQFDVEGLSSGSYMLKAICNNGCETAVSKFVKN